VGNLRHGLACLGVRQDVTIKQVTVLARKRSNGKTAIDFNHVMTGELRLVQLTTLRRAAGSLVIVVGVAFVVLALAVLRVGIVGAVVTVQVVVVIVVVVAVSAAIVIIVVVVVVVIVVIVVKSFPFSQKVIECSLFYACAK